MTELVTFGETMLRLTPPDGDRLSRVDTLDVHVGGAESNVAVAAANLGVEAEWLSALPEGDLGRRIVHALRGEGVETSVTWTDTGRVGTYYLERGATPRGRSVRYDREGTPIRETSAADLPLERVREAEVFLTTGITRALSPRASETTAALLETAREAGVRTAFDVNYRGKLWDPAAARSSLTDVLPLVDVLFVAARDAREVLGHDGDGASVARSLAAEHDIGTVVVTRGDDGALALRDGSVAERAAYPAETVDPVGSGDAFAGGFLAARLDDASVPDALAYGAAAAALKRTLEGDMAVLAPAEVEAVIEREGTGHIDR